MLKSLSWGLSVIFHPLLIAFYMLILLLLINPYLFGVSSISDVGAKRILLLVFLYTFFIPAISITVMYFLGFIKDINAPDREERIGPYLVTGMLYLWVYYNFYKTGQLPTAYVSFLLGIVVALFLAFFINIFSKISIHTVGMGGLLAMTVISFGWFSYGSFALPTALFGLTEVSMLSLIMVILVLAGMVGTARLLLKAHDPSDVFGGYLVGFTAQFFAFLYIF